jgi:hypothetical protein
LFSLDLNAVTYPFDTKDSVAALAELPRPTAGAGEPVLFASEYTLQIAYYTFGRDDAVALVTFSNPEAHYFGPPHVDAVDRHPLHSRGVDIYGAFEVHDSSWIRELRQISGSRMDGRHFILTFHDITFECIARDFTVSMHRGHPAEVIRSATNRSNQSLEPTAGRSDAYV